MRHSLPVLLLAVSGCVATVQVKQPPPRPASYDFTPTPPCRASGSTKLTLAVVSPRWADPSQPTAQVTAAPPYGSKPLFDLSAAMKGDFLELLGCRGFLTKGPFDSFDAMVYPDREGSHLLLEPELSIAVMLDNLTSAAKNIWGQPIALSPGGLPQKLSGTANINGRVTLTLKEPVSNTRMWTRSIEVAPASFAFQTDRAYGPTLTTSVRRAVIDDAALLRLLIPVLEEMYASVFKTADSYLNVTELTTVSAQAMELRKKAGVAIPRGGDR
jgi:hypothetical protein